MTSSNRLGWALLAIVLAWGGPVSVHGGFTITDLGIAGPQSATVATAISGSGAISGQVTSPSGTSALTWASGGGASRVDTSTLPGIQPTGSGAAYSVASGVNVGGSVVGTYLNYNDHGGQKYHAFATINGTAIDFGNLAGTSLVGASSKGVAIDSGGTILATAYLGGASTAFRSSKPGSIAVIALPTGGSNGVAAGMNASGTAVVNYTGAQGAERIAVSTAAGSTYDLFGSGSLRGFGVNVYASGIADNGDVAGFGDFNGQSHAFLATGTSPGGVGRLVDIGAIGGFNSSKALGLNSLGQVVGEMDASGYNSHAFLYDQGNGLVDLNALLSTADARRWTLTTATGINDAGQIVGQGLIGGQLHGFLLTPSLSLLAPNAIPTPPSVVLAVAGLVLVGGWSRLRRGRIGGRATA